MSATLIELLPSQGSHAAMSGVTWRYQIALRELKSGRRFPLGEPAEGVLSAARVQVEFLAIRRGVADADWSQLVVSEEPLHREGSTGPLASVRMIARGPGGAVQREFAVGQLFTHWSQEKLEQLIKSRAIASDEKVAIEVTASERSEAKECAGSSLADFSVTRSPLPLAGTLGREILDQATPCGAAGDDFPIVLPRSLESKAHQLCRHAAGAEGGVMIVGDLFRLTGGQPDLVGVAHAVLELRHATQTKFGFQPTTQTFVDLATQQQLRRNRLNFPSEVPLVLLHTHPFEPSIRDDGEANCKTCPIQKTCELTTIWECMGRLLGPSAWCSE